MNIKYSKHCHCRNLRWYGYTRLQCSQCAETRITYKSAKTTSSYYQMGSTNSSEAMKESGSDGEIS